MEPIEKVTNDFCLGCLREEIQDCCLYLSKLQEKKIKFNSFGIVNTLECPLSLLLLDKEFKKHFISSLDHSIKREFMHRSAKNKLNFLYNKNDALDLDREEKNLIFLNKDFQSFIESVLFDEGSEIKKIHFGFNKTINVFFDVNSGAEKKLFYKFEPLIKSFDKFFKNTYSMNLNKKFLSLLLFQIVKIES